MEHHAERRFPLGILYGLLGALFVWAAAYTIPTSGDVFDLVFRPAKVAGTPFVATWPEGLLTPIATDIGNRSTPPLERGDGILSVDGGLFGAGWSFSHR